MPKRFYFVCAFALMVVPLAAQVHPAAEGTRTPVAFWIGGSITTFNPDYGCENSSPFSCGEHQLIGVGPYVDTNYFLFDRLGVEGEARLLLFHGPETMVQTSYLAGPRLRLFRTGSLMLTRSSSSVAPTWTFPLPCSEAAVISPMLLAWPLIIALRNTLRGASNTNIRRGRGGTVSNAATGKGRAHSPMGLVLDSAMQFRRSIEQARTRHRRS